MPGELIRRGEAMRRLGCGRKVLARLLEEGRLAPRRWHARGRALFLRAEVDRVREEMRNGHEEARKLTKNGAEN